MKSRPACFSAGLLVAFGLVVSACGSDDADGAGGSGGTTTDAGDQDVQQTDAPVDSNDTDAGDAASDAASDNETPDVQQEAGPCIDVTSVSGSVIDEDDAPFSGADVILCIYQEGGKALCLSPKKTGASGEFTVGMPSGSACLLEAAYQIKSFADPTMVQQYCPADISAGGAITEPDPVKLVQAPACTRTPLGDTTQSHIITSPGGASITVIPDELFLIDYTYDELRVVTWDDATWGWPCFVDASNPPDGLVAFAPEIELKSEDALHVSFENDAGLAPGTVVDLYGLGGAATKSWDDTLVHEGHWKVIGEAVVSSDGSRIETRPGEGLPFGTWVGWKQK